MAPFLSEPKYDDYEPQGEELSLDEIRDALDGGAFLRRDPASRMVYTMRDGQLHDLFINGQKEWFPPEIAERLEKRILETGRKEELRDREACRAMVRNDWHLIASEIQRNEFLFVFDAEWMADKFGLALPR